MRRPPTACAIFASSRFRSDDARHREAGGALHGLRHSLLPHRLSGEQPDPRLERSRLSGQMARRRDATCIRPTNFRSYRPHLSCPLRGSLHAQSRKRAGDDQDHRERHRRQAPGPKGWVEPEPPEEETGKRVADRGLWLCGTCRRPTAGARRPRGACLREAMPRRAASCATAFPISRWRSIRSIAGCEQMEAEGVSFHYNVIRRDPRLPLR